ncbi:MAG TPA: hypothetical protein VFX98_16645, partial [Longimicrobiaceae bacterium]|nr:hypothetical protein [Longimicrobiaceae bacterium]
MSAVAEPLARLLLKNYLGEPAEGVAGGLLDVAKKRLGSYTEQREAARQFERLGEQVVLRLVPLFEREERNARVNVPTVADELRWTLEGNVSAEFFLSRELDPAKLAASLREARPIRKELLSAAEVALYNVALDEAVRYVVQVASQLPRFQQSLAAQSLARLGRMADQLDAVLDATHDLERSVAVLVTKAAEEDERAWRFEADYRLAIMRNLDELELFGVDVAEESRRHALSVA